MTDLKNIEELKQACVDAVKTAESDPNYGEHYKEWGPRLLDFLRYVRDADEETRASIEFQQRIWEENPVARVGLGRISVDAAIQDAGFRKWLAERSLSPLPQAAKARVAALGQLLAEIQAEVGKYTNRTPRLKIYRVLAGFFPSEFTTVSDKTKLFGFHGAMFGNRKRTGPACHGEILSRLREALGDPGDDLPAIVDRMRLPWLLCKYYVAPSDEEPTESTTVIPGEEKLVPLPATRRKKGLTSLTGDFQFVLNILESCRDGVSLEDLMSNYRSNKPGLKDPTIKMQINALIREFNCLEFNGDQYFLTDRGHAVLESGDPAELMDWLITRILGVDHVFVILRDEGSCPIEDLVPKIQQVNPGWTTDWTPNTIVTDLRILGMLAREEHNVLSLTDAGREWANRIHWRPEVLPNVPDPTPQPLNTILFGPPGTGKTYATTRRSVEICDGDAAPHDAAAVRARYGGLLEDGRIEFVTFHQSFGYEEFVEGLRPAAAKAQGGGMRLKVVDGVLKRIAERARRVPNLGARRIFKMALGDPKSSGGKPQDDALFAKCIDQGSVFLEYGGDIDWSDARYDYRNEILERWRRDRNSTATAYDRDVQAMRRFRIGMRPGDIVVVSDGYEHFRAVGEVSGEYEFRPRQDGLHHRRAVRWCWHVRDREGDSVSVFKSGRFKHGPINRMKPANPAGLARYLDGDVDREQPYVLVIDEINRANISKVMGELITLLEEDKREGAVNEVTATLPYSGERFTLPSNLHILGTMNTADRSIALLDTALRRRFRFEELSPDPDLLSEAAERTDVDLQRVLRAINERIEYLVDRDHLIGHAWFMNAKTRDDVDAVMRHKIIPLIAEYFYDDWNKVHAVLGGTGDFVTRVRLNAPPGLESDTGEERYRWTVRKTFAENAYENLIGAPSRETSDG